jgi:hypothetical protein
MISRLRRLHARLRDLLRGLLTGQARVREREGEVPRERFRRIARSIDAAELERARFPSSAESTGGARGVQQSLSA